MSVDDSSPGVDGPPKRARNLPRQQPPDPARFDYATFPAADLAAGSRWFRNHGLRVGDADLGVWNFTARDPRGAAEGRYDLSVTRDGVRLGTCYLASTERGAVNEYLGPDYFDRGFVDGPSLERRVVSEVRLPRAVRAADATSPDAFAFEVNSELFDTSDYELTQAYANQFAEVGFDGLCSRLRFSTDDSSALALFGPAGPPDPRPAGDPSPTPLRALVEAWGIPIEDPPGFASVDIRVSPSPDS